MFGCPNIRKQLGTVEGAAVELHNECEMIAGWGENKMQRHGCSINIPARREGEWKGGAMGLVKKAGWKITAEASAAWRKSCRATELESLTLT